MTEKTEVTKTSTDLDPLWSYRQFAAWVGVPERTVRGWVASGGGPRVVRLGRHVRIRAADAQAWLDRQYDRDAA